MEGLIKSVADFIVYVHPSQIKNVDKAILRELSSLLFKKQNEEENRLLEDIHDISKCFRT